MELLNFDQAEQIPGREYRGSAGRKLAYRYHDDVWMVKFSHSAYSCTGETTYSYVSSPLSEYIGSHIYESLGIPVHETVLGVCQGEVVVGCKDFALTKTLLDFRQIKNTVDEACFKKSFTSSKEGEYLDDALNVISVSDSFEGLREEAIERFWDMFVVDAFILNGHRDNENWGLLTDGSSVQLAPVFDNGNAFYNKYSAAEIKQQVCDTLSAFETVRQGESFFTDRNGSHILAYQYMASLVNQDCSQAVLRFLDRVDMGAIHSIVEGIPNTAYDLPIITNSQKQCYIRMLKTALDALLKPIAKRITEKGVY